MSLTAARALAQHGGVCVAQYCASAARVRALRALSTAGPAILPQARGPTPPLASVQNRGFSSSLGRPKKGGSAKAGKAEKKEKKGKGKDVAAASSSSSRPPSTAAAEDDDVAGQHPQADPTDAFNFADVESRWDRADAHHQDKCKELRRALSGAADSEGAVDVEAIGATLVKLDRGDGGVAPLADLALVIPRSGGRLVELRMHSADSRKAITRAVQASALFRGQQPQPDPDDELVLLVRFGAEAADTDTALAERARRVSDLANAWRAHIRKATSRRQKAHQQWKKDGAVRPDDLHRLERDLLKGQEKRLARVDTAEKELARQLESRGRR